MTKPRFILVTCAAIAFALAPVAFMAAQDPPATTDPAPATSVVEVVAPSATVAEPIVIETPLSAQEVEALAESAAESAEAVSSGEVTIAQATRNPADSIDPGSGSTFWLLGMIFGAVARPLINWLVEKMPTVDDRLAGAINAGTVVLFYAGAWALFAKSNPALPSSIESWLIAGFAATGVGSMLSSVQSMRKP